jgi:uncharacterized protein (DUF433 family)
MDSVETGILLGRIRRNTGSFEGKPVVRDIRIPVTLVLRQMAHGYSADYLVEQYEGLCHEDIKACLAYAANLIDKE